MRASLAATMVAAVAVVRAPAPVAADPGAPGNRGTVTAYGPDRDTVIDSEACAKTRLSWDYPACGARLRARVRARLCRGAGPGLRRYYYQVGDGRKLEAAAACRPAP